MLGFSEKWGSGRRSDCHAGGESFESVESTAFHRKSMYEICGEKNQLFTAYLR